MKKHANAKVIFKLKIVLICFKALKNKVKVIIIKRNKIKIAFKNIIEISSRLI